MLFSMVMCIHATKIMVNSYKEERFYADVYNARVFLPNVASVMYLYLLFRLYLLHALLNLV